MQDRHDTSYENTPSYLLDYERQVRDELEQLEWEEEQRRDGLLNGPSRFSGDLDLYRDIARGK